MMTRYGVAVELVGAREEIKQAIGTLAGSRPSVERIVLNRLTVANFAALRSCSIFAPNDSVEFLTLLSDPPRSLAPLDGFQGCLSARGGREEFLEVNQASSRVSSASQKPGRKSGCLLMPSNEHDAQRVVRLGIQTSPHLVHGTPNAVGCRSSMELDQFPQQIACFNGLANGSGGGMRKVSGGLR